MDDFKPIALEDKNIINEVFAADPPAISEFTFTNLFIWRHRYKPRWKFRKDCLFIIFEASPGKPVGLPPVGPGDKRAALAELMDFLQRTTSRPRIERVPEVYLEAHVDQKRFLAVEDPDNSDYVYLAGDLINLSGRKYHSKRNHLNRFLRTYGYSYRNLDPEFIECFLELQEQWCQLKNCAQDPSLLTEDYAVREALTHFEDLDYVGGAILVEDKVEAFSLGELLNPDTAVIHIEKANPKIPGLYAAINQMFCKNAWSGTTYINREQDLGIDGLRRAKRSYHPHQMVRKFTLIPA